MLDREVGERGCRQQRQQQQQQLQETDHQQVGGRHLQASSKAVQAEPREGAERQGEGEVGEGVGVADRVGEGKGPEVEQLGEEGGEGEGEGREGWRKMPPWSMRERESR